MYIVCTIKHYVKFIYIFCQYIIIFLNFNTNVLSICYNNIELNSIFNSVFRLLVGTVEQSF